MAAADFSRRMGGIQQPVKVLDNEFVTLVYRPASKIVHHTMKRIPTSEAFRALLVRGAELVEEHGAQKWLSDDRNNTVVREDDADWADTMWAPRVIRAGFTYWAIVLPAAAIGQLNMRRFAGEYRERGVTVSVFEQPEPALIWLESL